MILTFNNKILSAGTKWLEQGSSPTPPSPDPYNPLGLPPNTVRVRTSNGNPPSKYKDTTYESATLVEGTTDVYDVYKSGTDFSRLLGNAGGHNNNVVEVLGANTTGITNMEGMFLYCTVLRTVPLFDTTNVTSMNSMFSNCGSLTSVPLFNTANVTNMGSMFYSCSALTSVPLLNTSKVTGMGSMFMNCVSVESGALALYTQASGQATPPSNHYRTFYICGRDTTTGAAELAQIPSSWGGTGA